MTRPYRRELVHGTLTGYTYRGCRCEECLQARRDYYGNRPRAEVDAERAAQHGTESKYHAGCRCHQCRAAANAARRERRRFSVPTVHGRSGYSNGCRCETCRDAELAYKRDYRARKRVSV